MESPPHTKLFNNDSSVSGGCGGGGGLGYIEHTVTKYDTLAGVAIKYGVEVADIKRMNGLTTDLQMFSRKTLHIPLPGRHPPSPIMSNGHDSQGWKCTQKSERTNTYAKCLAQEKGDRIPILVNALEQPINDKSSQLTHFMGTLSRSGKYCPIHKPWNKVDAAKKQTLLEFLKTKFDIPECAETWILKSFGKKVKNWRARVKECYHDPFLSLHEQINSRPKQV